ncbi:IS110 family transposase [Desertimonas flava]|uniref:IS110 family transposase n=1 Tax=Desertimonas flava TaxID=2064846 RepID=UPI000E34476C
MHHQRLVVTGGVDTHGDVHVAAVLDPVGRVLATGSFPATTAGYRQLLSWLCRHGRVVQVGVEGTGSYGAGLARHLARHGVAVVEVNRPDRQARRRRGKSDTVDAIAAARAALSGDATATPKTGDGIVETIRSLQVARRSAVKARTQAGNQIRDLIVTAPDDLRAQLKGLNTVNRVAACARFRPGDYTDPTEGLRHALRHLARRWQALDVEITELDGALKMLTARANPALVAARGVGHEVAAALLVTAGDNPQRMQTEASFAALCGVSPIEASSGKTIRHRLNRGGDRRANNALWRIIMVRLQHDERTKAYVERRTAEGLSIREIIRCLKRAVAREMFRLLTNPPAVPNGADLRTARNTAGISLAVVAEQLGTWPTRISQLERGLQHDLDLATRYQTWLNTKIPAIAA